jgi:hypothetical protein
MLLVLACSLWRPPATLAQTTPSLSPSRLVIPFLASATNASALEFEAGECDVDASGRSMACTFQQVFLTTSDAPPDTCLITTNRYQRDFRRESASRWVSTEGPEGECGVLDVVTLDDDGGVRWTMETRTIATKKDASPECQAAGAQSERLSWRQIRRPLSCTFVQPGALTRIR